jgi:para-nitrobenzyl esterase
MDAIVEDGIVETASGRLRGARRAGIFSFKGVPYGDTTAGANRFMPPAPAPAWSGIRDALEYGHQAPQENRDRAPEIEWIRPTEPTGEDCLVLNVFSPGLNDGGERPVMVYLHGGAYAYGGGSAAGIDGTNLAKAGDVVVVTLNHRLNTFGYTYLGDRGDSRFASAGNAGMLDMVAALRWVRDNITAFGGNAGNVTIFGQSGGGSKVAVLMTMPIAKGLFHKAIMQSSSSHLCLSTMQTAGHAAHRLYEALDIPAGDPTPLQSVPTAKLLAAYKSAVAACGGNDSFRPVVDGNLIRNHPFDPLEPGLSDHVPLMIGSCETERSFYDVTADPKTLPMTEAQLLAAVKRFMGIDESSAATLIADYRSRRDGISGRDLYNVLCSDHMYRRNTVEAADRKAARGEAPVWLYEFTWKVPTRGGSLISPHTMCIPFVFGNTQAADPFTGTGPRQDELTRRTMGAWIAFARSGNPNHAGLPQWDTWSRETRPAMIFDDDCRIERHFKPEDLKAINACPPFVSDRQWPMP